MFIVFQVKCSLKNLFHCLTSLQNVMETPDRFCRVGCFVCVLYACDIFISSVYWMNILSYVDFFLWRTVQIMEKHCTATQENARGIAEFRCKCNCS